MGAEAGVDAEAGKKVLKVNGHTILAVTPAVKDDNEVVTTQSTVTSSSITLDTTDINHSGASNSGNSISEILDAHQNAIDAL